MTLIPKHILKEANKGGFHEDVQAITFYRNGVCFGEGKDVGTVVTHEQILLDPAFWQALGKARGWIVEVGEPLPGTLTKKAGLGPQDLWEAVAMEFYKLLLSNPTQKQLDEFWNSLP
jgi:hypothetical protein